MSIPFNIDNGRSYADGARQLANTLTAYGVKVPKGVTEALAVVDAITDVHEEPPNLAGRIAEAAPKDVAAIITEQAEARVPQKSVRLETWLRC